MDGGAPLPAVVLRAQRLALRWRRRNVGRAVVVWPSWRLSPAGALRPWVAGDRADRRDWCRRVLEKGVTGLAWAGISGFFGLAGLVSPLSGIGRSRPG